MRTQVLPLRQRAFELTQQQYNAMQVGLAGLVIARQQHLDALNTALDALKDYWLARVRLGAAVGTDFTLLTKGSP